LASQARSVALLFGDNFNRYALQNHPLCIIVFHATVKTYVCRKNQNLNKGISGIIGITFSLLTLSVFSQNELEARWQATPVAADGQTKEWTLPLRFSDSKSGLQYNITHDEANLYICIRVTDRTTQMQVLSSGIKVLIDENGKRNIL
jgi:hypothetical protein